MRYRLGRSALLLVALLLPLAQTQAAPRGSPMVKSHLLGKTPLRPAVQPMGLAGARKVQVMIQVTGDPVALVRASKPGKVLSTSEQRAVVAKLRAGHASLESSIAARGGRVLGHMEHAFNGLRVQIAANQVAGLRRLPGVVKVMPVRVFKRDNAESVPFIGAPAAWSGTPALHGEHIKVAVLDTGIDFTHADFGGPGTPEAYQAAFAADATAADPAYFGPDAPKVKGGYDLVGDAYDAGAAAGSPALTPQPDPNPLDCGGHGSHTAATIAGFGVLPDGTTFHGPYDASTPGVTFKIGPGVAPLADLYAYRVFGCEGSTDVVTEAIDRAVADGMNVISMSLGSPFGTADSSDSIAASNAAKAGVLVIASAGNSGPAPYLTGSPGAAEGTLSVAAVDSHEAFGGATITLNAGGPLTAIDANDAALPAGSLPVVVLRNQDGSISLGCSEAEYVDAQITGKLVVTLRGTCARVDRATFGAAHGAAAVAMINTSPGFPPWEGPLPGVAIPFLGVLQADGDTLAAATSATLAATHVENPTFRATASFSSGGLRAGDSGFKPEVSAPGVSIMSAAVGTGSEGQLMSGTSMACPHVSGVAALTAQAHPGWPVDDLRAAIVNTSDASQVAGYDAVLDGAGLVQPAVAARTQAVALAASGEVGARAASLSFGFEEFRYNLRVGRKVTVRNHGTAPITFTVSAAATGGSPHGVSVSRGTLRVNPNAESSFVVTVSLAVANVGDSSEFRNVAGLVTLTPATGQNNGVALHVPYAMAPRARSAVSAIKLARPTHQVLVNNLLGRIPGTADFYHWGLYSPSQGAGSVDLRAVGVQAYTDGDGNRTLVFAVNTYGRWSNAALNEYDLLVDVNGDGTPDWDIFTYDLGAITGGDYNGTTAVLLYDLNAGQMYLESYAIAPTDATTLFVPVYAADLGLSEGSPRFTYQAMAFDGYTGAAVTMPGSASFNAFTPALGDAIFFGLAAGKTVRVPITVNGAELASTPPRGVMVVGQENLTGDQAKLLSFP